jgi:P-type Cu2+ transporter
MTSAVLDLGVFVQHLSDGRERIELAVDGADCATCIPLIEDDVCREPGVARARLNLTEQRLAVEWQAGALDPARLVTRLARLGYKAYPFDAAAARTAEAEATQDLLIRLGVAAFATMNIMLLSVSVWAGNSSDITPETRDFFHWLSALIAIPTVAYAGQPFFVSARDALRRRALNMDVPISLGVLLAVGMSIFETAHHGEHAYFDSATMLLTFLLVGRWLERHMRRRTRAVAGNIAALKARVATRILSDGSTVDVPIAAIKPGDRVLVQPGARISVDGVVMQGQSEVDQSLVTGETRPVAVSSGTTIYAGTLNGHGLLHVNVLAAATGTLIDEVNRLIASATEGRSGFVELADRAARLYAPVVHVTAAATFIGWLLFGMAWQPALVIAITVLIITCPCALGLAVPAVQIVASGAFFRHKILINGASTIERLANADIIVFDKTGTLTTPEPELLNAGDIDDHALHFAGALASASRHPLARALAQAAGHPEAPTEASEVAGSGMEAFVDGGVQRLGSPAFCGLESEAAATLLRFPDASLICWRSESRSAVFALGQTLRPEAAETIARLRRMGFDPIILSGDRLSSVAPVAAALGISHFYGDLKPADKIARIDALTEAGRRVLMVGDGLNDAPALAAAHVSLSPISGADLTQAQADGVFLGASLRPVADAVSIARVARRTMAENLWLAVAYNAIAVPIAIAGFATPLVAALAMSGSSVLVTLNALRAATPEKDARP